MNTQDLAARIKLVTLNTGAWRPTRLHKGESQAENQRHGTGDRAKVSVRITDHLALVAIGKLHAEAYTAHRRLTLPSVQDGMRVVPCGKEMEHVQLMDAFKRRHQDKAMEFLADYEQEKASAPARLNMLYDPKMWPDRYEVSQRFTFETRYLPCPSDGAWEDWLQESAHAAQEEVKDRLVTAARRMTEACLEGKKLHQAVFDNLNDIATLAGNGFNLLDDPVIAASARELKRISEQQADLLVEDKSTRHEVGRKAAGILNKFGL